jgi:replicative DNA helicase
MNEHTLAAQTEERAILGAILGDNAAFYEAAASLREDELHLPSHRCIYAAISRLIGRGLDANTITVPEELRSTNELAEVGGIGYVHELVEGIPRGFSITSYIQTVKEKASRRELGKLGMALAESIEEPSRTADDILDAAEARMLEIRSGRDTTIGESFAESVGLFMRRMESGKEPQERSSRAPHRHPKARHADARLPAIGDNRRRRRLRRRQDFPVDSGGHRQRQPGRAGTPVFARDDEGAAISPHGLHRF